MIRNNEKVAANEVINAFNTGRSMPSQRSSNKPHSVNQPANLKIVDNIPQLRASRMRLDSGDTARGDHER